MCLFAPGMTALHKAGLAGLWMTLKALERENNGRAKLGNGSWDCSETSVTLRWEGEPEGFFKPLFKDSFKIDKNGLIWFPGLGEPKNNPQHAVVLQEAILGSFLQHGNTRKADKSSEPHGAISVEINEAPLVLRFHKVTSYAHQKSKYFPDKFNSLAGWQYPGGAVRHVGLQNSTALEEPPDRALALLYTPVGVIYFEIRSRGVGVRPRFALVIPEINNLEKYATARECFLKFGVQRFYASGIADAGLRVLSELEAANLLDDIRSAFCHVVSFGTVPWSLQQKTRIKLMIVHAGSEKVLQTFNLCRQFFAPRLIKAQNGSSFWGVPQVPDLAAQNLSEGRPWWVGFADFVSDQERRKNIFSYEKGGLANMVQNREAYPDGPEKTFVLACQEAWRRRMGQIGEKAKREGSSFPDQVSREFERLRVAFSRCKNAASMREVITDFWARGGAPLKALQDGWRDILTMLNEKEWRKAKDLALLALASYKPATKEESEVLELIDPEKEGGK